jgi:hypothetical protein
MPGYHETMIYEKAPAVPRQELQRRFESGSPGDVAHALVSAAFHEPDWRWVQTWCIRLADHADSNVQLVAIVALGHLARLHHTLDLESVLPLLSARAKDSALKGTVENTLDDIRMFIPNL